MTENANVHTPQELAKKEKGGAIFKTLLLVAIPIVLGNILESVTEIVDMHFIGTLGQTVMAGGSAATSVTALMLTFILGVGIAVSAYVSRAHGMGDHKLVGAVVSHAFIMAIILAVILAVVGTIFTDQIMITMTQGNAETAAYGAAYLHPMFLSVFILAVLFIMTCAFQGIGKPMVPMLVLVGVNIVNAILNPLLINGFGIAGSAYATIIARGLGAAAMVALMYMLPGAKKAGLRFARPFKWSGKLIGGLSTVALPSAIQGCIRNFGLMIMTALVAFFGTAAVAAYGVCTRTDMIALMIAMGISQAVCVLVGQSLGEGRVDKAVRIVRYAGILNVVIMGIIAIIYITAAPAILSFFGATGEALSIGLIWMSLVPLASILMSVAFTFGFAMNGAGMTWPGMIGAIIGQVVIPIAINVLAIANGWPIATVFIGVCIGIVANFIFDFSFYKSGIWKRHNLKGA
ncbi:MAG TPA: MATE family efflux transporter [Methanocorpusculum sp.]|nr:MATE family efflux transporter [Methanocorpusculum sp.]